MYGWRARIGRLAPSAATTAENEWAKASPDGVITVCSRYFIEQVTPEHLERMMGMGLALRGKPGGHPDPRDPAPRTVVRSVLGPGPATASAGRL